MSAQFASLGSLLVQYDGREGITTDTGGVSRWEDQTGNGNHAKQPDSARRPRKDRRIGGVHALAFTPADAHELESVATQDAMTVIVVGTAGPAADDAPIGSGAHGATDTPGFQIQRRASDGVLRLRLSDGTERAAIGTQAIADGEIFFAAVQWDGSNFGCRINEGPFETGTYALGTLGRAPIAIGNTGVNVATWNWNGKISFVLAYEEAIGPAHIDAAYRELNAIHGDAIGIVQRGNIGDFDPVLWLQLNEASGTPVDSSNSGLTAVLRGTPAAYQVRTSRGDGIDLGGVAHIEVPHHGVFETDLGAAHARYFSEVGTVCTVVVNRLVDDTLLYSKDDNEAVFAQGFSARAMADGRFIMRARTNWKQVELVAPAGTIVEGQEHQIACYFGREGIWALVDGRMINAGDKCNLHRYGWDFRERQDRLLNDAKIRIGKTGSSATADITVAQFAVFVTGSFADRHTLADAQTIAAASGAPIDHPIWGRRNRDLAGNATSQEVQAALNSVSDEGGGTVTLTGSAYTWSSDVQIPSRVRLRGQSKSGTVVTMTENARIFTPSVDEVREDADDSPPGAIAAGDVTYSLSNSRSAGDIMRVMHGKPIQDAFGGTRDDKTKFSDYLPLSSATTGSTVVWDRPSYNTYASGDLDYIDFFTPTTDICVENMTIQRTTSGGVATRILDIDGVLRGKFKNLKVHERATEHDHHAAHWRNSIDLYSPGGLEIRTDSENLREKDKNDLEYGLFITGCRDCAIHGGDFYSHGWHALSVSSRQMPKGRAMSSMRVEVVDSACQSVTKLQSVDSHVSTAIHFEGITTVGGGYNFDGWRGSVVEHTSLDATASTNLKSSWGTFRGMGECYFLNHTYQGKQKEWFGGRGALRNCIFVNMNKEDPAPESTEHVDNGGNVAINVTDPPPWHVA